MPRVKKTPPKRMVVASNEKTNRVIDVSSAAFFIEPGRCYIGNVVLEGMSEAGTIELIKSALSALAVVSPRNNDARLELGAAPSQGNPLPPGERLGTFDPAYIAGHYKLFNQRVFITGPDLPLDWPDDDKAQDGNADGQEALPF